MIDTFGHQFICINICKIGAVSIWIVNKMLTVSIIINLNCAGAGVFKFIFSKHDNSLFSKRNCHSWLIQIKNKQSTIEQSYIFSSFHLVIEFVSLSILQHLCPFQTHISINENRKKNQQVSIVAIVQRHSREQWNQSHKLFYKIRTERYYISAR